MIGCWPTSQFEKSAKQQLRKRSFAAVAAEAAVAAAAAEFERVFAVEFGRLFAASAWSVLAVVMQRWSMSWRADVQ